jgi:hypothetical protein
MTISPNNLFEFMVSFNVLVRDIKIKMTLEYDVAHMGEMRSSYVVLVGKHERKRPLGRLKNRWQDIVKITLYEA